MSSKTTYFKKLNTKKIHLVMEAVGREANVEKLNVWEAYEQAKSNCNDYEPLVVMKKNQKKPLVVVDADFFISLFKKDDK